MDNTSFIKENVNYNPKQRMLNAYKGNYSDRYPVAPEFWYYYSARTLGVTMVELEREIPFWKALKETFKKYNCEGWGVAFPQINNPSLGRSVMLKKDSENQFLETTNYKYKNAEFQSIKVFDLSEPSWVTKHLAEDIRELPKIIDMLLDQENVVDYKDARSAYNEVGNSYLLEMWTGVPFFDFIAELTGFEQAVMYFFEEEETTLLKYRDRYTEYQKEYVRRIAQNTPFESFMIGCSYSCNSLIGAEMWRKWDKPYLHDITDEIHTQGKLLHVHFHGRSIECIEDFAEIGIDAVCPFERPPGGDIQGLQGLREVRERLHGKVTFNGNVHTIETLIRGTTEQVKREVREVKAAFEGSPRLIIGSGDQVGRETPEENILAMIEEAKASS